VSRRSIRPAGLSAEFSARLAMPVGVGVGGALLMVLAGSVSSSTWYIGDQRLPARALLQPP